MDSGCDKSGSNSGNTDEKSKASGSWLERLPSGVIQGILSSRNKSQKAESTCRSNIPNEIIQEILLRLPITSVIQSGLINKSFLKIVKSEHFALMHFKHGSDNDPLLFFHFGNRMPRSFPDYLSHLNFDSLNRNTGRVKRIDIPFKDLMPEYSIIGSCRGYMCLFNDSKDMCSVWGLIYNPIRVHFRELPIPSQVLENLCAYGFGVSTESGEYKVLMVGYCSEELARNRTHIRADVQPVVQVLTVGGSRGWRILQTPVCWLDGNQRSYEKRGLWFSGSLHWMTSKTILINGAQEPERVQLIIAFDLGSEEFREIRAPNSTSDLLNMRGYLSAFANHRQGRLEIWVMKDYGVEGSWSPEFVMGHYIPAALRHSDNDSGNWISARVVCRLKNGKFLMRYGFEAWCFYDPETDLYEHLVIQGLPKEFETIAHVGSMIAIDTITQKLV